MLSEPTIGARPATAPRGAAPEFRPALAGPRGRAWIAANQAWLGLAGLMLGGVVVVASASRTPVILPRSVRPLPSSLAGAFGQGGIDIGLGGFVATMVLMFASYLAVVSNAHRLTLRPVLIGIGCLNLLVLLAPPLLSTDVFSYIAYGRIGAVYGFNPYVSGPSSILLDPLYPFIGSQWVKTPTAYGPLFTALSYPLAYLSIAANVIAYKTIAALSSLVIVLVAWSAARLRGLNPIKVTAVVGLNPVMIVFGVGGGHNDLLMLALLLTGMYVLLQQKERTCGALIVAAAAVKLTAAVMLPFAVAERARAHAGAGGRRTVLAGAGIAAATIAGLSFAAFGPGLLHLLPTLHAVQSNGGVDSLPGLVLTLLGLEAVAGGVGLALNAVLLICLALLVRRVWTGRLDWITATGWATVAMLCTAGLLLPWYVIWLVPIAALSSDRRLLLASIALTGLALTTL